jgi:tetraacyldisaccharide 4'-kinase
MRAPDYWAEGRWGLPTLLSPVAALYDAAGRMRRAMVTPLYVGVPVFCVGNIVAGGGGKTPTAMAIAQRLHRRNCNVHFLTRGYGGRESGPTLVSVAIHTAEDVGDEALLLAHVSATWVARDRRAGARAAIAAGADVIVMDDGFQNPSLHKDICLIAVDAGMRFGNGHVIPAGPLRETVARGLTRADAVLSIADPLRGQKDTPAKMNGVPVLTGSLEAGPEALRLNGERVFAFAGIARPQKFFDSLRGLGVDVIAEHAFADHHRYRGDEIMTLVEQAATLEAILVTTEKDFVRLPAEAQSMVETLPVSLQFDDDAAIDQLLDRLLESKPPTSVPATSVPSDG